MLNQCANPTCSKPLLYLREGRIFIFDMPVAGPFAVVSGFKTHRLEHFWLCGDCCTNLLLRQSSEGLLELVPRLTETRGRMPVESEKVPRATTAVAS